MKDIVNYQLEDRIAVITMDDGKANALSHDLIDALNEALDRAEEADALILAGREGRFSAGFDLRVMASGPEAVVSLLTAGMELFMRIYEFDKPVVSAVTGHAIAGGVLLAATTDTRIGVEGDFKIGLNEVTNGMPVPILAHRLASDRLDPRAFVESVLQAKIYNPRTAVEAGWLDRIVDPESLEGEAMAEAKRLSELPAAAYALTKKSIRNESIEHIRSTLGANLREMASAMGS